MTPQDPNRSDRPSWRASPKAAPLGGRTPAGRGGWTQRRDRGRDQAVLRYRTRVAAWFLLFAALTVGFIVYVFYLPVRTPLVIAAAARCEAPLAPNAWVCEDVEHLLSLKAEEIVTYTDEIRAWTDVVWTTKEQGQRRLREQLIGVKPGGPGKDVVMVYLSMHGAVDASGEPCLVPPDASPLKSDQWLRVRDLLAYLFPREGTPAQPDRVKKLLIFDSSRMDANWDMGLLYNGFADRLQAVVEEARVPNLIVLSSAGPGQIGWAAPELKGSVFAYFLWQGLRGAADAENAGNHDGKVSLAELYEYLRAHVGQWVTENRADVQQPLLVPHDADVRLAYAHAGGRTALPAREIDDPRWNDIRTLWERHARLRQSSPWRFHPLGWEEFQHKLLRLEQLIQAGKAYEAEFADLRTEADNLATTLGEDPLGRRVAVYSLPLANVLGRPPKQQQPDDLPAPWRMPAAPATAPSAAGIPGAAGVSPAPGAGATGLPVASATPSAPGAASVPGAKPGTAGTSPAAGPQPPPAEAAPVPERPYAYWPAVTATWQWYLDNPARDDLLPQVLRFVDRAQGRPEADIVEIHFLRMLNLYLDPLVWKHTAGPVKQALLTRQLAEQAAAPADARAHYWIRQAVDQSDQERRLAEDGLFIGTDDALADSAARWARLSGADGTYPAAVAQAEQIVKTFELRDRAWATIPYLAQWRLARLHPSDPGESTLGELIQYGQQLGAQLDEAITDGQWPPQLQETARRLRKNLQEQEAAFQAECSALATVGADKKALRAIGTVLAVPLVSGQQRNDLRRQYLEIAKQVGPMDTGDRVAIQEGGTKTPAAAAPDAAGAYLDRLKSSAEHPALAILRRTPLAADRPAPGADRAASAELARQTQLRTLGQQGEEVRQRLGTLAAEAETRLADTARLLKAEDAESKPPAIVRAGRSQADRLVRTAAALLGRTPWSDPGADPVVLLRSLDLGYLLRWHARRCLDDFWGPAPGRETPYFQTVAEGYRKSALELCRGEAGPTGTQGDLAALLAARSKAATDAMRLEKPKDLFLDAKDTVVAHRLAVALSDGLPQGKAAVYLQDLKGQLFPVADKQEAREPNVRRMGIAVDATRSAAAPVPGDSPGTSAGAKQMLPYWLVNSERLRENSVLRAMMLYRGHTRWRDFYVQPATGLDIVAQRAAYPPPRITVFGATRQDSSLMLILDCSGSMGSPVKVGDRTASRLEIARNTLREILARLAVPDSPYRVGLRIYGHRVGWNPASPNDMVVPDPQNPRKLIPKPPELNLQPNTDVELVLAPGPFTKPDFDHVSRKLDTLRNMGETPLYLAILQSIGDLERDTKAQQRHIIAITDGFNEQSGTGPDLKFASDVELVLTPGPFTKPDFDHVSRKLDTLRNLGETPLYLAILQSIDDLERDTKAQQRHIIAITDGFNEQSGTGPDLKFASDVERALRAHPGVRLDIVGFNLEENPAEQKIVRDLTTLSGGAFYSTANPASLLRALETSLALSRYLVETVPGRRSLTPVALELNAPCTVDRLLEGPTPLAVRLAEEETAEPAKVAVEGGESLELYVESDALGRRHLVHRRYDKAQRDFCDNLIARDDEQKRSFYVAAHMPDWDGSAACFFVSVQNADPKQFSPRPAEVWIEVRPVLSAGDPEAAAVYVFYDPRYEPYLPVPVIRCLAPNWPAAATTARIQVWCKLHKTPARAIAVRQFREQPPRLDGAPEVQFEIETKAPEKPGQPHRVMVTERHPAGSDFYNVKVEMRPPADTVRHSFNVKAGTVRHTFVYQEAGDAAVENYQVLLTARKDLLADAIALPRPLEVTLTRK